MKKLYARLVWCLIGPVVRAEVERQQSALSATIRAEFQRRDDSLHGHLKAQISGLHSRHSIRGKPSLDDLKERLHFWRTIRTGLDDLDAFDRDRLAAQRLIDRTRQKRRP